MASTANELLYDATIRHQIKLLRYSNGQANAVSKLLKAADDELVAKLQSGLSEASEARLKALLADVRAQREAVAEAVGKEIKKDSQELAENEANWELEAIKSSSPIELKLNAVAGSTLKALTGKPINGVPLEGWLGTMKAGDISRIEQQLRLGLSQGETIDQMVGRIRGTKANNYEDGVTAITRRNAQTIARTAANHMSNSARQEVWNANADIISGVRWVATLDGRTSDVCRGRDGQVYPIDKGPRPPGHPGCRSTTVPVLDGASILGDRPFVRDTRTRAQREVDFRAEAKEAAGDKWKGMSKDERTAAIRARRDKWGDENIGTVQTSETYDTWLRKQPKAFQDEILGPGKAQIFREGTTLDKFVDEKGKPYTIAELKAETAKDALHVVQPGVGMKAKSLLQQGLPTDQVLAQIKAEFPEANTTAASLASYKTELKKAGSLDQLVGKVPSGPVKQAVAVSDVLANMEASLPPGLKHAVGGQWATIAEDLDGVPGAYGYYEAGKGVLLSAKKLSAVSQQQAQQVMSHELGHLLHKQHGVTLHPVSVGQLNEARKGLEGDAKKLYSYYTSSMDELTAEVYAQALSPSPLTSQGLSAIEFNKHFGSFIEEAKEALKDAFPVPHVSAPPPSKGAPSVPFEVAGKHTTVGGLAKALLQQGLPDDKVLEAVLAEFPTAKTSKASLASYKVELKKAGLLPNKASGPTVQVKPVVVPPEPPKPAVGFTEVQLGGIENIKGGLKENSYFMEILGKPEFLSSATSSTAYLKIKKNVLKVFGPDTGTKMMATALEDLKLAAVPKPEPIPGLKVPELLAKKPYFTADVLKTLENTKAMFEMGCTSEQVAGLLSQGVMSSNTPAQIAKFMDLAQYELQLAKAAGKPYLQAALSPAVEAEVPLKVPYLFGKKNTLSGAQLNVLQEAKLSLQAGKPFDTVVSDVLASGVSGTGSHVQAAEFVELAQYELKLSPGVAPGAKAPPAPAFKPVRPPVPAQKPALLGKPLGGISTKALDEMMVAIAQGKTDLDLKKIMTKAFSGYDPTLGQPLMDLAKYKVAIWDEGAAAALGKLEAKAAAEKAAQEAAQKLAAEEAAMAKVALTPSRVAATPREGIPPPPRFTQQQHRAAIKRYGLSMSERTMEKLNKIQKAHGLEPLTLEESTALYEYTTNNVYGKMNKALREGRYASDVALQAYVEAAQIGMKKLPKYVGETARGIRTVPPELLKQMLAVYRPGAIVEEAAFTSTSAGSKAAFSGPVYFRITSSKTGIDIAPASAYGHEKEILYMPGTRFRVLKVEKLETGTHVFTMEEV
jgi:SPP1 gp7 family putative phage head morphogenesis protein